MSSLYTENKADEQLRKARVMSVTSEHVKPCF